MRDAEQVRTLGRLSRDLFAGPSDARLGEHQVAKSVPIGGLAAPHHGGA
jgi:hypothetical protein